MTEGFDGNHWARAMELKQEVFDGKRTPRSALVALEAEFGTLERLQVNDLWQKAWWAGIPGAAHEVDVSLLTAARWSIFQGRGREGVDGEGQPIKRSKWYFSPPGYSGVYSGAHGTRREAESTAAKVARRIQVDVQAGEVIG